MIKIYKLIHQCQIVYVGQTKKKYLSSRKSSGYKANAELNIIYKECKIELIEETDDASRERYWIERLTSEGHPLLNKRGGYTGLDIKEYYQNNKEKIKDYQKEYSQKDEVKIRRRQIVKKYNQKDEVKIRRKQYRKEYYEKNKK